MVFSFSFFFFYKSKMDPRASRGWRSIKRHLSGERFRGMNVSRIRGGCEINYFVNRIKYARSNSEK